jgi:hypothetical protein
MSRDVGLNDNPFFRAAYAEAEGVEAISQWIQDRAEVVHSTVSVHDVLRHFGVKLRYPGSTHEEQISCPFHGKDVKPSCRIYPQDSQSPSHTWCFTCQEWLDAVGVWKKFRGLEKFTHALSEIEKAYGIKPPEAPLVARRKQAAEEGEEVMALYEAVERRLFSCKKSFTLKGYLTVGSILDRIRTKLEERSIDYKTARTVLQQVLAKIGEKERTWDAG